MKTKVVLTLVLLSLAMPVFAQQIETRLSDALFYEQVSNYQPANIQAQNNVVFVSRKDPWIAGALSFLVTGLGQVYNGEPVKGLAFFGGVVAGYTLFFLAIEDNYYNYYGFYVDPEGDDDSGVIGLLSAVGIWIVSIVDAPISANRINKRNAAINARQINQQSFSAAPLFRPNQVGAALTLRW